MSEENAATPVAENKGGNPPAPAPATPAPVGDDNKVVLTKEEHAQLAKDAARAQSAQKELDRITRFNGRKGKTFAASPVAPVAPVTPPSKEELEIQGSQEDAKAERGLMAIAVDPKYRELLDADPTLRNLLTTNPLGALPLLAPDSLDAQDAIELVREALDERVKGLKKEPPVTPPPAPATPPAGAANPTETQLNTEYEAAKKIPNTETAISEMVKVGLKKQPKI